LATAGKSPVCAALLAAFLVMAIPVINGTAHAEKAGLQQCVGAGHEFWPPFSYLAKDSTIEGIGHDVARRAFSLAGGNFVTVHVGPWKRVFGNIDAGTIDVIVSANYSTERAEKYLVTDPIGTEQLFMLVAAADTRTFKSWDDLRGLRMVGLRGNNYGEKWLRFSADNIEFVEVPGPIEVLKMILSGRADFTLGTQKVIDLTVKIANLTDQFRVPPNPLIEVPVHMLIRRDSPCATLVPKVNAALATMRANGELAAIERQYGINPKSGDGREMESLPYSLSAPVPIPRTSPPATGE
jgi:polar amino acid transport system substrate-binding protein